jgi:hypothetical protein
LVVGGFGFRVWAFGFRVEGIGLRVEGIWYGVLRVGFIGCGFKEG